MLKKQFQEYTPNVALEISTPVGVLRIKHKQADSAVLYWCEFAHQQITPYCTSVEQAWHDGLVWLYYKCKEVVDNFISAPVQVRVA